MHINNLKENEKLLKSSKRFNHKIGRYLVKNGIPILHYDGDHYYFANTEELAKAIKDLPIYLKLLYKWGGEV